MESKTLKSKFINPFYFLVLTVIFRSLNPILFKKAAISLNEFTFLNIITNIFYLASFGIFFLRALTWQITLSNYTLSYAYPFMSLSFVVILATGYFLFEEKVYWNNVVGSAFIIIGTIIMAKHSDE